MRRQLSLVAAALLVLTLLTPTATWAKSGPPGAPSGLAATARVNAALQVGPIDPASVFQGNPNSGWPSFYQDDLGNRVALVPITGDGATAPTQVFAPPVAGNPYSTFLGFGAEAFYYIATANAGPVSLEWAVEAAYASAQPTAGQEITFTRTRIRAQLTAAGTYTIQTPYQTHIFNVATVGPDLEINFTEDIGGLARDFATATTGPVTSYLRQAVPPPPAGWIGDGVTSATVTGSPTGFNQVRVSGPGGLQFQTDQFVVSGRLIPTLTPSFTKTLNPVTCVAPCTVTFAGTATGGTPTSWSWDFGDGTTSNVQNPPDKTYNTAGNFTVKLTVTDASGSASTTQTVSVYSMPVASFTKSAATGTAPLAVNFSDTSTGNVTGWSWSFGDGTTSTAKNPSKTFSAAGTFTVTLTVTNPAGSASTSQTVTVSAPVVQPTPTPQPPQQQLPQPTATPAPTPTPIPPTPTPTPEPQVTPVAKAAGETTAIIRPNKEVELELEDKTTITVPAAALSTVTVQMKAHKVEEKDLPKPITKGKVRKAIEIELFDDKGVKLGPTAIQQAITIAVPLTAADLAAIGENPNNVELHRYDDGLGVWVKLAAQADLPNKVIRAQLRHLSLFAVVVPAPVAQAQPTPTAAPPSAGGTVPGSPAWLAAIVVGLGILLFGFRLLRGARQPVKKE